MRGRILIVDDDPTGELLLRAPLEREGFTLEFVRETGAAIESLGSASYGAVILQLAITPAVNGFAVLSFVERQQPALLPRIFLLTSISEQTVMNMDPRLVPRLFRKPYDKRRLVTSIVEATASDDRERHDHEKRLLIVDDDRMSSELIATLVAGLPLTVHFAENGREAIEKLTASRFDAVVLDLIMPGIDGFGVLEYLHRCCREVIPHTIVVSALPERYRDRVAQYPVCGTIEKPLDHRVLQKMIAECALTPAAATA
jgi:CheY-like chemotaxis protein